MSTTAVGPRTDAPRAAGASGLAGAHLALTGRGTLVRVVETWGTVITLELALAPGTTAEPSLVRAVAGAFDDCEAELDRIDRLFSTYRPDSRVSDLRSGRVDETGLGLEGDDLLVVGVLDECRRLRTLSGGSFDPWAVTGGLDPSAYVKGWGAGRLADLLLSRDLPGVVGVCVNAGGDLSVRGSQTNGSPWTIGVRDPRDPSRVLRVIEAGSGHVATSGRYERGEHVVDPLAVGRGGAGRPLSATVWGPDDGAADALATALLLDGRDGASWFRRVMELDTGIGRPVSRWGAYVVESDGAWRLGETDALSGVGSDALTP